MQARRNGYLLTFKLNAANNYSCRIYFFIILGITCCKEKS